MLQILDVTNTGRRRRFSLAEKIRIVEESLSGPKLARATARRYGIALSGLYQWRRQYQRGELGGEVPAFRAVELFPEGIAPAVSTAVTSGPIEIALSNGRRVIVPPDVDAGVLMRFVQILERA
ncbi:IS66-like element accessory protein TnpA [Rhodobacter capsulatus]|uniref:IS66-like element accessory protein TnpA n=1 Tax=Rhodobacter capsulatus TaxID=1061 RepID=UPI00402968D0